MRHKEKLKIARRMANSDNSLWYKDKNGDRHKKKGYGVFDGEKWQNRKTAIEERVKRKIIEKRRAIEKKRRLKVKQSKYGRN